MSDKDNDRLECMQWRLLWACKMFPNSHWDLLKQFTIIVMWQRQVGFLALERSVMMSAALAQFWSDRYGLHY